MDGSSTGTRVPMMWAPFEAPTIGRSYPCSQFSTIKCVALMRLAKWSYGRNLGAGKLEFYNSDGTGRQTVLRHVRQRDGQSRHVVHA